MKLLSKEKENIVTRTYEVELDNGRKVTLIDYHKETGKIIDTILRDAEGNTIEDPIILEEVIEFLNWAPEIEKD